MSFEAASIHSFTVVILEQTGPMNILALGSKAPGVPISGILFSLQFHELLFF